MFNFLKETRTELKHVSWPTRNQAIAFSIVVIIISLVVAAFLGLLDYIFKLGLEHFIG